MKDTENRSSRQSQASIAGPADYGVYALREAYAGTLFRSMLLMLAATLMVSLLALKTGEQNEKQETLPVFTSDSLITTTVHIPPAPEPPADNPAGKPQADPITSASRNMLISDTLTASDSSAIFTAHSSGTDTSSGNHDAHVSAGGSGTVTSSQTLTTAITAPEADELPEFEGGLQGLYKFIATQIRYPEEARAASAEGTVHIRFVVDQNGRVSEVSLLHRAGYGMDEEAVRVIEMLPDFKKAARAKGQPVSMYYQLPIRFRLN